MVSLLDPMSIVLWFRVPDLHPPGIDSDTWLVMEVN